MCAQQTAKVGGATLLDVTYGSAEMITAIVLIAAAVARGGAPQALTIQRVEWLQGCWQLASPQRIVEEHWMGPRAGTMLGMGRTVRGETLVEYESVLIREQEGRLAYEAHPSGQPAARFVASRATETEVTSRIPSTTIRSVSVIHETGLTCADRAGLTARTKGQPKRVEFPYHRAACAGQ